MSSEFSVQWEWHVQAPANLLPAPSSEVVIEDVTDAPAEVMPSLLFCHACDAELAWTCGNWCSLY